jgi:hypothetical protein
MTGQRVDASTTRRHLTSDWDVPAEGAGVDESSGIAQEERWEETGQASGSGVPVGSSGASNT